MILGISLLKYTYITWLMNYWFDTKKKKFIFNPYFFNELVKKSTQIITKGSICCYIGTRFRKTKLES